MVVLQANKEPAHLAQFPRTVPIAADEKFWENEEKERRKLNLIIYNMPESTADSAIDRRDADEGEMCELLQEIGFDNMQITHSSRLGKKDENRPRLLRVGLTDYMLKQAILRRSRMLRQTDRWERVFIAPDLTFKERDERKVLLDEMKTRKEAGEENLTIYKNRIIKKVADTQPFRVLQKKK